MENKNQIDITLEELTKQIFKRRTCECVKCIHNVICPDKKENFKTGCEHFKNDLDPRIYGNIYEMFDPVFEWLKINYPRGDVKFVVDYSSAKMYLEHGVSVFDKSLREFPKKFSDDKDCGDNEK